jgi:hypothetical protein
MGLGMMVAKLDLKQSTTLQELLELLKQHREIILLEDETTVVKVTTIEKSIPEQGMPPPGLFPDIVIHDDFNDPLPDEFWLGDDALLS